MNEVKKKTENTETIAAVVTELFFILLPVFILWGVSMGKQDESLMDHNHGVLFELLLSTMLFYANILRIVTTPSWVAASGQWRLLKWIATPISILGLVFTGVLLAGDLKGPPSFCWVVILCGIGLTLWASVSWHMIDRQKRLESWRSEGGSQAALNKLRGVPEGDEENTTTGSSGTKKPD
ncbi:hypothetical protein [Nitrosospira sp. NRS527]|uniref:hypothetical protein n=1 Tax=Nitrosospira sp. NRS527 TaxID=155925 RepID=UPI001BCE88DF|nr:hypothetical protein [Nitrosospira sp. NRS527]